MTILLKLIPKIKKFDDYISWKYKLLNSAIFKLKGGYKCSCCGKRHILYSNSEAEYFMKYNGTRMLLSWSRSTSHYESLNRILHKSGAKSEVICKDCLILAVKRIFYCKTLKIGKCDFTGKENVPVLSSIDVQDSPYDIVIRFGREWWNGFSASEEALLEAISNWVEKSSIYSYRSGKVYCHSGQYVFEQPKPQPLIRKLL